MRVATFALAPSAEGELTCGMRLVLPPLPPLPPKITAEAEGARETVVPETTTAGPPAARVVEPET